MILKNLQIKNFRNLKRFEYEAHNNLNIFMGDNAQGKTNILEAIYVTATGSSFRTNIDNNLINYDEDFYLIRTKYHLNERLFESSIKYEQSKSKLFKINNKKVSLNNPDRLKTVLFIPDDLSLVKGSPVKRRSFMDYILKQLSEEYFYNFDNYGKILRKRNLLLRNDQGNSKTFNIINELFLETSAKIIISRINFVAIFDQILEPIYTEITNGKNNLKVKYALSFQLENEIINYNSLLKSLIDVQTRIKIAELNKKKTLIGPHLDDLHIYQDNKIAIHFASQGQQRNIAVSLKLAEVYTFKRLKKYYPVFLLDEVLAELDEERRTLLLNHLSNAKFQSFLTTVTSSNLKKVPGRLSIVREGSLI